VSATPSAQYRLTIRVRVDDAQGTLGLLPGAIAQAGGMVGAVDLVEVEGTHSLRDVVVDASGQEHWERIIDAIEALSGVQVIDTTDRTFLLHVGGKIEQHNKHPLKTRDDLSMAYTPGVARVCLAIADDEDKAFQYTIKRNTVAVVSDGSAVLGLGDIGPRAAMPVMEGKCCLFKEFGGVDAFPICLDTNDAQEIVRTVKLIAPAFGGINLEDISAPRCFEIEAQLKEQLDIPVFHDDQHGTAVVVMAALLNAVKLTGRRLGDLKVLVIGLGAAGIAVTKILLAAGVSRIVGADSRGALHVQREDILDAIQRIEKYSRAGRAAFDRDELVQTWIVHHLQIIGEAVRALSDETRNRQPGISWAQIAGMRNILVHDYFGIDLEEVWAAVERDLPPLKAAVSALLGDNSARS
jgi:malate dehydrogenase (oxaloacetate-decarboxylating)